MRDCSVQLEREQKIESIKQEVVSDSTSIDKGGDDDEYDYYPEDSYYDESGSPGPSPAKKMKTESSGGYLHIPTYFDVLSQVNNFRVIADFSGVRRFRGRATQVKIEMF